MFLTTTKCLRLGSTLQIFLKTFSTICPHCESFSSWLQDSEDYLTFHLLLLSRFDPFFTFYFFIFILFVGYSSFFFPHNTLSIDLKCLSYHFSSSCFCLFQCVYFKILTTIHFD